MTGAGGAPLDRGVGSDRSSRSARASRGVVVWAVAAVVSLAPLPGCADRSTGDGFAREYARLHGSTEAAMLSATPATEAQIVATIRAVYPPDLPILLPARLPDGFSLAAPFRGTGSGNPLPNPDAWTSGYAVTYTDGRARVTVLVGAADLAEDATWESTNRTVEGRPLFVSREEAIIIVSTDPSGSAPVAVIGERLDDATLIELAAGLREPLGG